MRRWRFGSGAVVFASLLVEQGCLFKKAPPKAAVVIPPAPQVQQPAPMALPPQLPPTQPNPAVKATVPELPPPTPPAPTKPNRQTRRPVQAQQQPPTTTPVTDPNAVAGQTTDSPPAPILTPGPSLQPILGQQEIAERNRRIQQYLDKARLVVVRAERGTPDTASKELIGQVRTFLQQAEDARKVDLVRAENLAERAEVLSRGLVR